YALSLNNKYASLALSKKPLDENDAASDKAVLSPAPNKPKLTVSAQQKSNFKRKIKPDIADPQILLNMVSEKITKIGNSITANQRMGLESHKKILNEYIKSGIKITPNDSQAIIQNVNEHIGSLLNNEAPVARLTDYSGQRAFIRNEVRQNKFAAEDLPMIQLDVVQELWPSGPLF
ncbi:hypothetical protein, partial [Roseibium hamelinense]